MIAVDLGGCWTETDRDPFRRLFPEQRFVFEPGIYATLGIEQLVFKKLRNLVKQSMQFCGSLVGVSSCEN